MPYYRGNQLSEVYERAARDGYGFVASNTTHPDIMQGLLDGAVAAESDIVLQIKRDTAEYLGNGDVAAGLEIMQAHVRTLSESLDVGVFLNVDHVAADDQELIDAAIESGHPSSMMIDASAYPFEENVERTAAVVDRIDDRDEDLLVEAELGTIAGTESGETTEEAFYTDPAEAVEFVDRTGCDLLAVSIGTEHGVSAGVDLDLRVDLAADIHTALREHGFEVPLVVHGSSGLTPEQVSALMETGVCKLNTNTRYQYEYARTACEFYHDNADAIIPPEGIADDRATFFADADWAPDKSRFNPQVVGRAVRERIATVHAELAETAGSAGESLFPHGASR
ncbi:fructose-1,6-bisphosphate aldolase, class II [Haloarcula mannanilytica]|uniref:Fructose-1,6-bisphosphate aldolase, class II n=1 Tax=Haloarcula mannanilytica TaxID=2509225 RepID=A0A4C2EIV8_9EURY|nr:class II fructose-bisphosphate aldolase [Haloarcula mannanilytica]GCF14431.1 fructose-1,6-bisphosphate aldolase, class II [Haloarcula mannanilytica]